MSEPGAAGGGRGTEDEDARHRREEQERRAQRKASKHARSDAQIEKDRRRQEYRQKILQQHGGGVASSSSPGVAAAAGGSSHKRRKTDVTGGATVTSAFQSLFTQRAQGFQIDFRFRNAPPRPPVGPCFVGNSIDTVLLEACRQYKPLNAVEVNYTWKLHTESDLGVPLAHSAMDVRSYEKNANTSLEDRHLQSKLHPDDAALLDWQGSLGDTAADSLKRRKDQNRAEAARMVMAGRTLTTKSGTLSHVNNSQAAGVARAVAAATKKAFSRVLDEGMQTWMKKTTYLSNDYSRRVHDFKSLAQTKQEQVADLQTKHQEISKRRSAMTIQAAFHVDSTQLKHPTKKNLKPKHVMQVLPNVSHWGRAFTHVVIDKAPGLPKSYEMDALKQSFVTHVERKEANARMSCQMLVPSTKESLEKLKDAEIPDKTEPFVSVQAFDLDVIPLKEEDSPHQHFCLWLDRERGVVTYLPIASRVQLSTGRPIRRPVIYPLERRTMTSPERTAMEERMVEVDRDLAEKHHLVVESKSRKYTSTLLSSKTSKDGLHVASGPANKAIIKEDDGEGDFGDDDDDDDDDASSEDEQVFGGGTSTIVAEN